MKKYTNLSFSNLCINPSECMNEDSIIKKNEHNLIYKPNISFDHHDYINQHMFDEPYSLNDLNNRYNMHPVKTATERYHQSLERSI